MKSKVTNLYAYRAEPLPDRMGRWHVTDEEIEKNLAALAATHAAEERVEVVEAGDGVRCMCVGNAFLPHRSSVLLFPGRGLSFAEAGEKAVVGKKVGDLFETTIGGKKLTLKVVEILRRYPAPINDALVSRAGIEGVSTLKEYTQWYREQNELEHRRQAIGGIVMYWMQLLTERSTFAIEEEEQQAWALENGERMYEHMLAVGEDPHIPEEGVEFLTKEQTIEKLARQYLPYYKNGVVIRALAEKMGIHFDGEYLEKRYQQIAEYRGVSLEEAKAGVSEEALLDTDYANKVYELLSAEAEALLEV